ncbi:MAG: 16S rRNA (cytosine(1402)-N(4))-methyltransferase RsmH [Candidatus Hydrogenedens sp.]
MTNEKHHIPVMANEVINLFQEREKGIFVDATIGAGGHTSYILEYLSPRMVVGIDRDPKAIQICSKKFEKEKRVKIYHANYADMDKVINILGIQEVDGILIDAGLSSFALDDEERGFSFQKDGPLDMRMNTDEKETLGDFLDRTDEHTLAKILKEYGDVVKPYSIAKKIIMRRREGKIRKVSDIVQTVLEDFHYVNHIPDEVRQVFQALRIAVNNELFFLRKGLWAGLKILAIHGRFIVISFHSGEDRIVKSMFRFVSQPLRILSPEGILREQISPIARNLTPKPVAPSSEEIKINSRAKSARLRAIEKISDTYIQHYISKGV